MQPKLSTRWLVGVLFALAACGGGQAASGVRDGRGPGAYGIVAAEPGSGELSPELRREIGLDPEPTQYAELGPELRREIGLDP
jgi:hypothetical protein